MVTHYSKTLTAMRCSCRRRVAVVTRRDDLASVPGRFGWDGGYGTSWYADPSEDLVAILMTQCVGFPSRIDLDFWTSVYQALDD